jgi:8-amino-7-oxononanoate synthase
MPRDAILGEKNSQEGSMDKLQNLSSRLQELRRRGLVREYREVVTAPRKASVSVDGREALMFCTNDYLGLSKHPKIIAAMKDAADRYGCGAGGSRFIGGTHPLHHAVETSIARLHGKEAAALFSSGYSANLGSLSALAQEGDLIFSDELNHASIIDGCRMSRAKTHKWRHNDAGHLEDLLRHNPSDGCRFIVCESLYSMDGDFCPLADIVALAQAHDCFLFLDEIHALGIYGERGEGYAEATGVAGRVDILMGGASKALGVVGGYVATSKVIATYMKSRARAFIFTTALPAPILTAIAAALEAMADGADLRRRVHRNADLLRRQLDEHEFDYLSSRSHILPIVTGDPETTRLVSQSLLERGVYAQGVIFPSVPFDKGRLRVTVTPQHSEEDVHRLVACLREIRDEIGFSATPQPAGTPLPIRSAG